MGAMGLVYYLLFSFVMTGLLLFVYFKASHKYQWFDKPDEARKLHSINKPTSAGLLFFVPVLLDFLWLPNPLFPYAYVVGISLLLLLLIGGIDDFFSISAKSKLMAVVLVSTLILYALFKDNPFSYWIIIIYMIGMVWWINLFNFMDGADGMVALHAIVSIFGYVILFFWAHNFEVLTYLYLMLICLFAFLLFNFPISRMFMGDSGSLSLGFFIGVFALYGIFLEVFDWVLVVSFHLVFIVDSTLTLLTRVVYKQKFTSAHKLHYYQAFIESGKSHAVVSFLYFVLSAILVSIAVTLHLMDTTFLIRLSILIFETLILSYFWTNFHNKTKFKRFVQ